MAVLEKIRVKMGAFITVLIGLALLSFIIDPATFETAVSMFSSKYDVGEMNGKSISYQDYQKKIDYYTQIYQITSGGASSDDQVQEYINESAWQDFVSEYVVLPTIKNAGIGVGEEEMYDLTQGREISPVLMRERIFHGPEGNFDRTLVADLVREINLDQSGSVAAYWGYLENAIYTEQMFNKYSSLLLKSTVMNPVELAREIDNNNITSSVDFIMKPIGFGADTTITISAEEVKNYYDVHKKQYKRNASRDIEYVVYEVVPSEKDYELAKVDIDKVYEGFTTASNLKNYLARNSDEPLDPHYYAKGELEQVSPELEEFAFSAGMKDVLPVFESGESYKAARISDVKMMSDSIYVKHILLQGYDQAALDARADSIINVLNSGKGNFQALAEQLSADRGSRNNGNFGELGWLTQTYMLPGFEQLLYAPADKYMKVRTDYGTHVVMVTEKTKPVRKVQLAVLVKDVIASRATFQEYYSQANDLATRSEGKIENFNNIAKEENLRVYNANGIIDGAKTVATYDNARELSRWAYEAKVGDVSQIITVDNKYFFVAALTSIKEEGYTPIEEVQGQIRMTLMNRKKGEKIAAQMKAETEGLSTMEQIAEKLGTTVSHEDAVSFGAFSSRSFDPAFIGAVAGAELNKIEGPVVGNVGVYMFNVTDRETGAFYTEDDAQRRNMQSAQYQMRMLPSVWTDQAGVKDTRAKFF